MLRKILADSFKHDVHKPQGKDGSNEEFDCKDENLHLEPVNNEMKELLQYCLTEGNGKEGKIRRPTPNSSSARRNIHTWSSCMIKCRN